MTTAGAVLALAAPLAAGATGAEPQGGAAVSMSPAEFNGVSALAPDDAWAVGETGNPLNHGARTLIQHWDGTAWSTVASQNPGGSNSSFLFAVSADTASDAWAAGSYETSSGEVSTAAQHWNGTAWKSVTTPDPTKLGQYALISVSAVSPQRAFGIMGFNPVDPKRGVPDDHQPFPGWIIEWNGTAWVKTYLPAASKGDSILSSVSADSATDAWAVGGLFTRGGQAQPVIAHGDGATWTRVSIPRQPGRTDLLGVSALSPTDVWAVGWHSNPGEQTRITTWHWNGTSWRKVAAPDPDPSVPWELDSVSAVSADDVWAIGSGNFGHTLVLHWDGVSWTSVPIPDKTGELHSVSAESPTDAWIVGRFGAQTAPHTILDHWDGTSWMRS